MKKKSEKIVSPPEKFEKSVLKQPVFERVKIKARPKTKNGWGVEIPAHQRNIILSPTF